MARGDNRRTKKMKARKSQRKKKARARSRKEAGKKK